MSEYKDLEVARAERKPIAHLWNNKDWIAEKKLDGWRMALHFGGPCSRLYATTRGGDEVGRSVSHLTPQNYGGLGYTVLDGEIIPHAGEEFHSLASIRAGVNGGHKYHAFDILFLNGTDVRNLPLAQRLELLNAILTQLYPNHSYVLTTPRALSNTHQFLNEMLEAGGEGCVLKNIKSSYGNGWLKAKRFSTFDTIIAGFQPGYHMEHGKVFMAVCDGITLRDVGKCGIANTEVRAAMNKDPNTYIGKVIEVRAMKIDPSNGILREPRFIRMRPDMKPTDATWQKLNQDAMEISLE